MTRAAFGLGLGLVASLAGSLGYLAGGGGRVSAPPAPPGFFGSAPSFADVVAQVNPAVVHVDVIEDGPGVRRRGRRRRPGPGPAAARRGLGLHRRPRGLHPHQPPPGAGRRAGSACGSPTGASCPRGSWAPTRAPTSRCSSSTRAGCRRCGSATPTACASGDWVCAIGNPLEFDHTVTVGRRVVARPQDLEQVLRRLHPDRRRHQPRQLGRAARQPRGRGRRDQRGREQRGAGDRLRGADQRGARGAGPAARPRHGRARLPGHRAAGARPRPRAA